MAQLSPREKLHLLSHVPLFQGLTPRELSELLAAATTRRLGAKQELFHKGDPGTRVYIVVEGRLKAFTTSEEGDDVVFGILGPNEVIGEIALFGDTTRTATVTSIDPCELLVLERRDFLAFLRRHPEASIRMLSVLAARLKRVSELVEDTLFLNLPLRLAKKLMSLARDYGQETEEGLRINLKLSQEEWGDLVGATRESVNKQVRAWTEEGLVAVDRGYFVIKRPAELERLAGAAMV